MDRYLYVLEGRIARPARSVFEWVRWYANPSEAQLVARSALGGGLTLVTIFLGIAPKDQPEHAFSSAALFANGESAMLARYITWDEADYGHGYLAQAISTYMQGDSYSPHAAAMQARERWRTRLAMTIDPEET